MLKVILILLLLAPNCYAGEIITTGEDEEIRTTVLNEELRQKLDELYEDDSPELGADLDLNGYNLDFASVKNISDCLDEDTMVSNSATALATQQSIKAYVDGMPDNSTIELLGGSFQVKDGGITNAKLANPVLMAHLIPTDTIEYSASVTGDNTAYNINTYLCNISDQMSSVTIKVDVATSWDNMWFRVKIGDNYSAWDETKTDYANFDSETYTVSGLSNSDTGRGVSVTIQAKSDDNNLTGYCKNFKIY